MSLQPLSDFRVCAVAGCGWPLELFERPATSDGPNAFNLTRPKHIVVGPHGRFPRPRARGDAGFVMRERECVSTVHHHPCVHRAI